MIILKSFILAGTPVVFSIKGSTRDPLIQVNLVGKVLGIPNVSRVIKDYDESERRTIDESVGRHHLHPTFLTIKEMKKLVNVYNTDKCLAFTLWYEELLTELGIMRFVQNYNLTIRGSLSDPWFRVPEIAKVLEYSSGFSLSSIPKCNKAKFAVDMSNVKTGHINKAGIKQICVKSRKRNASEVAEFLGMDVHNQQYDCIETSALKTIMEFFHNEKMIDQFEDGPYILDLYFPERKIAIEIDEAEGHHHGESNICRDRKRQKIILKKLGCKFFRCNMRDGRKAIFDVLKLIHDELMKQSCKILT